MPISEVFGFSSVTDTTLFKRLEEHFDSAPESLHAEQLCEVLPAICESACERMRGMATLHPEYTLHDETHLVRVTELMARVLQDSIRALNPVEIAILILSAYLHDQGMVLSADELARMKASSEFQTFRQNWETSHPNMAAIRKEASRPDLSSLERERLGQLEAELENAIQTDYIRLTHGKRSADHIRETYGTDERLNIATVNLSNAVALVSQSHVWSANDLTGKNGFYNDHLIGNYSVNLQYLAIVLRLADILDFDRERTPDELFRSIHFTNDVSLSEWEKHRGVNGWMISGNAVRFDMEFEHPAYERCARKFLDWVDRELFDAHGIVRSFPSEIAKKYQLTLPHNVDRSRITPRDSSYVYHDLEFVLSRDEVVNLLMTDNLYGSSSLAIRELIQNGLDALRHRRAVHAIDGSEFAGGKLVLNHDVNSSGQHFLRCSDNGIGMDSEIITTFLTNVGRSYYRSATFDQERIRFREAGVDFDPCARFGIGFMSAFMLGDHITIETRRDLGPSKGHGQPWIVEIQGIGGMVIIREGTELQSVGTSVTIILRDTPTYSDKWIDPVKLLEVAQGYTLLSDFPIECECKLPGIEGAAVVPVGLPPVETVLERAKVAKKVIVTQDFCEIDPNLGGHIKQAFLLNEKTQLPTVENDEGIWVKSNHNVEFQPKREMEQYWNLDRISDGQTCMDGILVSGDPGRGEKTKTLGSRANAIKISSPFILDIRGDSKPRLRPDRTPLLTNSLDRTPDWERIQGLVDRAEGRICEKLAEFQNQGMPPEDFWNLCFVHRLWVPKMRIGQIWNRVQFPLRSKNNRLSWHSLEEIGCLKLEATDESVRLLSEDGKELLASKAMTAWDSQQLGINWFIKATATFSGELALVQNETRLVFSEPSDPECSPWARRLIGAYSREIGRYVLEYDPTIGDCLSAQSAIESANWRHPMVRQAVEAQFSINSTRLQEFSTVLTYCLSNRDILSIIQDDKPATRWMKVMAHKYLAVDWSVYDEEFQPPYRLWINGSKTDIDADTLKRWAEAKIVDEED